MRLSQSKEFIDSNPIFALASAGRPHLHEGQMAILYEALEPFPAEYSLEQLVSRCIAAKYPKTFRNPKTEIRKSILYQLNRLLNGTGKVPANSVRLIGIKK